jgi:hypothetical protein
MAREYDGDIKDREIEFRGQDAILIEILPKAWPINYRFYYGIRHSDEDWDLPITIEPYVLCNRWGWIGLKKPLELCVGRDGYLELTEKEQELFLDRD